MRETQMSSRMWKIRRNPCLERISKVLENAGQKKEAASTETLAAMSDFRALLLL
jgi:hypothetical protein